MRWLSTLGRLSRRRDRRLSHIPLTLLIDGIPYRTADWSLGGFRVAGYDGGRGMDDEIHVEIRVEVGDETLTGGALAVVLRAEPDGELAARFRDFHGNTWDLLEQISIRRLRPRMVEDLPLGQDKS